MPNIVLDCEHIWKKISNHVIVNDFSLKLYEKDILGFIGSNGAGKTTTIKLLLGLQSLNGGKITIGGFNLQKDFVKAISNVGAIIENPDLYMYLTGYDNLKIVAKLYHLDEARIHEVTRLVGLEDKINIPVKKYSLGMRQRLGIAQAIIHKPKLLILDEPMNGLDPMGIKDLKTLLTKLASEENMAIIISSHILSELECFCNRICIIEKGRLIKDTTTTEIKQLTENLYYNLEVSNTKLDNILYKYEALDETHIRIFTPKDKVTNIIKTLLLNDISIYEVSPQKISLEEIFLKMKKEHHYD